MRIHSIWVIAILLLLITTHTEGKIVFTSSRDGVTDVYSMNEDGSRVLKLTDDEFTESAPVWSPDGEQIAFTRYIGPENGIQQLDIFIMDADGSKQQNLTTHPAVDYSPSWSPDGRRIAFSSNRTGKHEVHIINILSGAIEKMTNNKDVGGFATNPSWSPNGRSIVYTQGVPRQSTIYIMNVTTKTEKPIIQKKADLVRNHARLSPDGKHILYHEIDFKEFPKNHNINNPFHFLLFFHIRRGELVIFSVDGFNTPELTIPEEWSIGFKSDWAKNSQEFVFSASLKGFGNSDIYHYNLVTDEFINLTNQSNSDDSDPYFLNPVFSVSPAGRMPTLWGKLKK